MHSIGVDIGGTSIKAARVYPDGTTGDVCTVTTPRQASDIVSAIVDCVEHVGPSETAGIAVAAFLDASRETVLMSPNIDWGDRRLRYELAELLGRRVVLENDANAAGWAEFRVGAGRNTSSMVMLTLGTGVGGAVVVHDAVLPGSRGIAGELGHIIVEPGGLVCGCGQRGCVETVSSGRAMMRMAAEATGVSVDTPATLDAILADNAPLQASILDRVAEGLLRAIVNIQAVVDPDVVVIGGGVADRVGSALTEALERLTPTVLAGRRSSDFPPLVLASLGNRAGIVGAGLLAANASATDD